ncbi:MAG: adenosylcobinamide-GDP ribazoletransferase [Burkholderiaceae bacterium]|nr:adenosylcobinamide-GDP ribazoletransferase [Burkholderiaceae bacterium]
MPGLARHSLLALQFFTRIPITGRLAAWVGFSPSLMRRSAAHFPGVGWVVGTAAAAVFALLIALLGFGLAAAAVAAVFSTAASVWLTGAFHEDGLADCADALGGSAGRDQALGIMKDSRIGSYGAVALVLALALKCALLVLLAERGGFALAALALLVAHVLSRLMPLLLMRALPYVGEAGGSKSKPLADAVSWGGVCAGVAWTAPALALLGWLLGAGALLAVVALPVLALLYMLRLLRRRLQGFTGDTLGATQQVCELAAYLALAINASSRSLW